jgi:predicted  nucleic acid-binding Zn-ribbon protein
METVSKAEFDNLCDRYDELYRKSVPYQDEINEKTNKIRRLNHKIISLEKEVTDLKALLENYDKIKEIVNGEDYYG